MALHPVVLSGGSGTRLWPLSRTHQPKQLLPLVTENSLLQDTLGRLTGLDCAPAILVCNQEQRFVVAEQAREAGVSQACILLEPCGRNTAPAIAVAALAVLETDPDGMMLVLPSDHQVRDVAAFQRAVEVALAAARAGRLVTFGVEPEAPETGYGYIQRGAPLVGTEGAWSVARFVEKPDRERAEAYLAEGGYSWNSGMFLFRADRLLAELERLRPDIAGAVRQAWDRRRQDLDFCRLDPDTFAACPSESIDYAVMEHTGLAAVVPVAMGWSDVGSWGALWRESPDRDARGNIARGDVFLAEDVADSYVRAESRLVAVLGLENVVVVETRDAVLVVHRDQAQEVRQVVAHLARQGRTEHLSHARVLRPWGWYEGVDEGERFQVKRLMVKPGHKLSLQRHHHRAEHWVVVRGTARVTRGDETLMLSENESTFIPLGVAHRLENPGRIPLHIVEVQSGSYLGEDDIVRLDDEYRRD